MIYKNLGKNGIKASVVGFGCWQLGGNLVIEKNPHGYGKIDEKEAIEAIDYSKSLNLKVITLPLDYSSLDFCLSNEDKIDSYTISGNIKDAKFNLVGNSSLDNINFNFKAKDKLTIISNLNFRYQDLNLLSKYQR